MHLVVDIPGLLHYFVLFPLSYVDMQKKNHEDTTALGDLELIDI